MKTLITAVLVLYKLSPEQSPAFTSLRDCILSNPDLAAQITLLIYDNSPEPHALSLFPAPAEYLHDPANPGLATAYNVALNRTDATWLLLLDQDTTLTPGYFAEALATLPVVAQDVAAVLPQLVQNGHVHSPQLLPRLSSRALPEGFHGVPAQPITAFNSGAFLRVSALAKIGNFPTDFPLDFLDHATFHRLAEPSGKFHVLNAELAHDLSTTSLGGDASLARYKKILLAEHRFHAQTAGSQALWQRLRRLKQAAGHLLKVRDKRFAWQDLRAAFGLVDR